MLIDGINAREGPQNGLIMLFDMKGVKLSHVIKLPIYSVRKSLEYIQARITKAPDRLAVCDRIFSRAPISFSGCDSGETEIHSRRQRTFPHRQNYAVG